MGTPAEPIPISTLFNGFNSLSKIRRITATSHLGIDEALRGGFEAGQISCISGETGTAKSLIVLHTLTSFLLSSTTARATVVDTTGGFDLLRLYEIIRHRVKVQQKAPSSFHAPLQDDTRNNSSVEEITERVLQNIKISRVFDFSGLNDSISELVAAFSTEQRRHLERQGPLPSRHENRPKRCEIPDSEDEDDEMLFDNESANHQHLSHMLVIDNIAPVVFPVLRNYMQGHALLAELMRSIAAFTSDNDSITILTNSAVTPRSQAAGPAQSSRALFEDSASKRIGAGRHASVFASVKSYPALGRIFPHFLDLHLFLSVLPRTEKDAKILYGSSSGAGTVGREKAELVNVLEVMADRYGNRVGRWAPFKVENGVLLRDLDMSK